MIKIKKKGFAQILTKNGKNYPGHVPAVRKIKIKYVTKVKQTAPKVPRGMDRPGSFNSPDMFAPKYKSLLL